MTDPDHHLQGTLLLLLPMQRLADSNFTRDLPLIESLSSSMKGAIREALQVLPHHHIQAVLGEAPGQVRAMSTISARLATFPANRDDRIEDSYLCNLHLFHLRGLINEVAKMLFCWCRFFLGELFTCFSFTARSCLFLAGARLSVESCLQVRLKVSVSGSRQRH